MNLVLHGIEDFQIMREDTLRNPAFTDSSTGGLATFDCVIANPPFSLKEWGRDVWASDPWGRALFGLPPESYGDFAWVQHMVASMAARTGRMAVVLPQGALFRKDAEGRIRKALLEQDLIEGVIGLAPNAFYGTGLAPAVVVLRRTKPAARECERRYGYSAKKVARDDCSLVSPSGCTTTRGTLHRSSPRHSKRDVGKEGSRAAGGEFHWVPRVRRVQRRAHQPFRAARRKPA